MKIDYDFDELIEDIKSELEKIGLIFLREEDREDLNYIRILSFVYDDYIIDTTIYGESDKKFMISYIYSEFVNGHKTASEDETLSYTVVGIPVDNLVRVDKSIRIFSKMIELYQKEQKKEE